MKLFQVHYFRVHPNEKNAGRMNSLRPLEPFGGIMFRIFGAN